MLGADARVREPADRALRHDARRRDRRHAAARRALERRDGADRVRGAAAGFAPRRRRRARRRAGDAARRSAGNAGARWAACRDRCASSACRARSRRARRGRRDAVDRHLQSAAVRLRRRRGRSTSAPIDAPTRMGINDEEAVDPAKRVRDGRRIPVARVERLRPCRAKDLRVPGCLGARVLEVLECSSAWVLEVLGCSEVRSPAAGEKSLRPCRGGQADSEARHRRLRPHLSEDMEIRAKVSASVRGGGGPRRQCRAPAAMPSEDEQLERGISVSSRWGWGPSASAERLRPCRAEDMESERSISVSSRWGWGPTASASRYIDEQHQQRAGDGGREPGCHRHRRRPGRLDRLDAARPAGLPGRAVRARALPALPHRRVAHPRDLLGAQAAQHAATR